MRILHCIQAYVLLFPSPKSIHIGNVPFQTTWQELKELLSEVAGSVAFVKIPTNPGGRFACTIFKSRCSHPFLIAPRDSHWPRSRPKSQHSVALPNSTDPSSVTARLSSDMIRVIPTSPTRPFSVDSILYFA